MLEETCRIERLARPAGATDLHDLALLLIDAVDSGAAVSFLPPLTPERAGDWWRRTLAASDVRAIFLVARDRNGIAGSVQMHPAWAPNQPHRGDIAKLLVHRRCRRTGLGTRLMLEVEDQARRGGFTLLTLDAKRGGAAEALYRRLGWTVAGTIPEYALDADGTPHDTVIFYKRLDREGRLQDDDSGGGSRGSSHPQEGLSASNASSPAAPEAGRGGTRNQRRQSVLYSAVLRYFIPESTATVTTV